jgi:hypothetical protein
LIDRTVFAFCYRCGAPIKTRDARCSDCGATQPGQGRAQIAESPKSFGVAVVLCGIFGTLGVHHFYLGNILHGLFDLGLAIGAIVCFVLGATTAGPGLIFLGFVLIVLDAIHTIIVFYKLITGQQLDGDGMLVTFPGQH